MSTGHIIGAEPTKVNGVLSIGQNAIIAAMGWKTMRVAVCDVCGHRWIPESENPPNCPSKKCRSTLWDKAGVDGRTREARIKTGRSRKTMARKNR
jgi:hypothetical protein